MPRTLFATICTPDYLPRAVVLHESLRAVYGEEAAFVAFHLGESSPPPLERPGLELIGPEALGLPNFWDMAFRYEKGALANGLKPFVLARLLAERRPRTLVFLDADTLVYSRLEEVHALVEEGRASIVLTPHVDRPQIRTREPQEIDLLRHGVMNGGFVALAPDANAAAFLAWWSDHLATGCRYAPDQGYYGDQRWLDLVPALFDGVHVLRHRGYNAAYWNDPDRAPARAAGRWRIGEAPLRFYHFSQWRLEQGETVEGAVRRLYSGRDDPALADLLADYAARWTAAAALSPLPPGAADPFGRFLDGTPIPCVVRDAYARAAPRPAAPTREALFGRGLALVMDRSTEVPAFPGIEMPHLYVHIWHSRPDLRRFDLRTREGQLAFMRWLLAHAAADHGLPEAALAPARHAAESQARRLRELQEARARIVEAHAKVGAGEAGLGDLIAPAAALAHSLDDGAGWDAPIAGAVDLFRAIDAARSATIARHPDGDLERYFQEIDGHVAYLASKYELDRVEFLAHGADLCDELLEADAVRNVASVLIDLLARRIERGDAPPPAPASAGSSAA